MMKDKNPGFHDEDDGDADDDDAWLWREGKTKVGTEAARLRETSGSHSLVRSSVPKNFVTNEWLKSRQSRLGTPAAT